MSDLLVTSHTVYADLDDFTERFRDEAELINEAKCQLFSFNELRNMSLSKGAATVSEYENGYYVRYNGLELYLEVNGRMISDYTIK
ncbi:MAG: hypothetical protein IKE38_03225 [Erysipelotrichaceae bacterium]|nr:hypothetical protein [Erysipelotrichaceae bacterium]